MGINRLQWRGRGGFSPRFPILRTSAPEPFIIFNCSMCKLYHLADLYANFFDNESLHRCVKFLSPRIAEDAVCVYGIAKSTV